MTSPRPATARWAHRHDARAGLEITDLARVAHVVRHAVHAALVALALKVQRRRVERVTPRGSASATQTRTGSVWPRKQCRAGQHQRHFEGVSQVRLDGTRVVRHQLGIAEHVQAQDEHRGRAFASSAACASTSSKKASRS